MGNFTGICTICFAFFNHFWLRPLSSVPKTRANGLWYFTLLKCLASIFKAAADMLKAFASKNEITSSELAEAIGEKDTPHTVSDYLGVVKVSFGIGNNNCIPPSGSSVRNKAPMLPGFSGASTTRTRLSLSTVISLI